MHMKILRTLKKESNMTLFDNPTANLTDFPADDSDHDLKISFLSSLDEEEPKAQELNFEIYLKCFEMDEEELHILNQSQNQKKRFPMSMS